MTKEIYDMIHNNQLYKFHLQKSCATILDQPMESLLGKSVKDVIQLAIEKKKEKDPNWKCPELPPEILEQVFEAYAEEKKDNEHVEQAN